MSSASRWIVAGAVVALAVGGGWLWWQAGLEADAASAAADVRPASTAPSDAEHDAPRFERQPAAAEPLAAAEAAPAAAAATAPAADVSKLETLARLVGRVTRHDTGEPVEGLTVRAYFLPKALVPEFTHEVTDAGGRYQFALSQATQVVSIAVRPGPETRWTNQRLDLRLELGAEVEQDLEVMPGATVSGSVQDQDGRPVPGARVRGWNQAAFAVDLQENTEPDQEVAADATGAFSVGGLGPTCVLAGDAPGLTCTTRLTGELASGARVEGVTLVLGPARDIRGVVLESGDRPVADCSVSAAPEALDTQAQLSGVPGIYRVAPARLRILGGADGQFVLPDLASVPYQVGVTSDRHQPWEGRHSPGDPDLTIRLDAGTSLSGDVVSVHGGPVGDADVMLWSLADGPWPRPLRDTHTDEVGHFKFGGLRAEDTGLLAIREDRHAIQVEQPVVITEVGPNQVRVVLDDARALAGIVVDEHDQPIAARHLSIQGDRVLPLKEGMTVSPLPTWEALFPEGSDTLTDEDGRFRFDQLYDGAFELRVAEENGKGTAVSLQLRSGQDDLHIVVDTSRAAGVTFAGTVRDALTGKPVESFRFTPMIPSGGGGMSGDDVAFAGPDGAFRITGIEPGPIEPWLQAPGYSDLHVPLKTYAAGEYQLDLQMSQERVLKLRVVDEDRQPVTGAKLTFLDEAGEPMWVKSGPHSGTTNLETDEAGEAVAMGLPAARITVHVKQGWFGGGQDFRFDLRTELRGTQVLVLGDDEQATVLVFFFGASQPVAIDPGGQGLQQAMQSLQQQLAAGSAWPVQTTITVRALAADGKVLAEGHVDPQAPGSASTPLPDVTGACNVKLSVPAEPLEIEVSAQGYETVRRSWQPDRSSDEDDVVVLVLRKL